MTKNTALYVDENCHFSVHRDASIPEPEDGEIQVVTLYSGVNPADVKHATDLGIRSTVIGYDFCGRVTRTPLNSKFSPGDIIAGYTPTGIGRPSRYGTHQSCLICPEDMAFHVPKQVPKSHAACLNVVAMTAADALYNLFGLPLPSEQKKRDSSSGPLLIWGASTGVGICSLQFARASGAHPIFVTASPGRHMALEQLGATRCFDYSSPNVVTDIKDAVQAAQCGPIKYALDAVGSQQALISAELMAQCVPEDSNLVSVDGSE